MGKRRDVETIKISVAITHEDLETLRSRAKRVHGGNLSAAVADAAAKLRREEAAHRLLGRLGVAPISDERAAEIEAELRATKGRPLPKTRRRKKVA